MGNKIAVLMLNKDLHRRMLKKLPEVGRNWRFLPQFYKPYSFFR